MDFLVVVTCPNTHKEIFTGVTADVHKLDNLPRQPMTVRCPHCASPHDWSSHDALLARSVID